MRLRTQIALATTVLLYGVTATAGQTAETVEARVQRVMARPEFARSNFGIEFFDLETGKVLYAVNADKLFVPFLLGMAFAEAIAIYALVVTFTL